MLEVHHDPYFCRPWTTTFSPTHKHCQKCFPVSQLHHLQMSQMPSSLFWNSFPFHTSVRSFFTTLIAFPYLQADFWKIFFPVFWILLRGKIFLHYSTCQNWKYNTKYDNVISSRWPLITSYKLNKNFLVNLLEFPIQKQVPLEWWFYPVLSNNNEKTKRLVNSFIQQISIECLLCPGHWSRPWRYNGK